MVTCLARPALACAWEPRVDARWVGDAADPCGCHPMGMVGCVDTRKPRRTRVSGESSASSVDPSWPDAPPLRGRAAADCRRRWRPASGVVKETVAPWRAPEDCDRE